MQRGCASSSPCHLQGCSDPFVIRYNPINLEWFNSEIYATFYGQNAGPITEEPLLADRLSLLFMVLAIGSLMNTTLPAYNLDAEKYHQLARAALFHFSFLDNPTLTSVQTLVSNCLYC
jgi:hypothetical protein